MAFIPNFFSSPWRPVFLGLMLGGMGLHSGAQISTERAPNLREHTPRWHAITGARLMLAPGRVLEQGTLVMRDGVITAVGAGVRPPAGAKVWHLPGRTVYAGFIDLNSHAGVPSGLSASAQQLPPQDEDEESDPDLPSAKSHKSPLTQRSIASRHPLVHPEQEVAPQLQWPNPAAKGLRQAGFTSVLAAPSAGIFRGQSALVSLAGSGESASARTAVLNARVAQHVAFEFNSPGGESYPTSLMGSIALIRQTFLDARWQQAALAARQKPAAMATERLEQNASLAALSAALAGRQRVMFEGRDEQDDARIAALRDEFGLQAIMLGHGREYRRVDTLRALGLPVVLPLNFPEAPEIQHPDAEFDLPLEALQHWEHAPANAARLVAAGVPIALSSVGLRNPGQEFWPRVRRAVAHGLSPQAALAALTTTPAQWLGESQRLGELAVGRLAHVVVARGDLFTEAKAHIELGFIDGHVMPSAGHTPDWRGRWLVETTNTPASAPILEIRGTPQAPSAQLNGLNCELGKLGQQWVLSLPCAPEDKDEEGKGRSSPGAEGSSKPGVSPAKPPKVAPSGRWIFTAVAPSEFETPTRLVGTQQDGNGPIRPWAAKALHSDDSAKAQDTPDEAGSAKEPPSPPWPKRYPAGAFGIASPEQVSSLLVRQATVWTQGPEGRLPASDVWIRQGKIAAIGRDLKVPAGTRVIEAQGKHLTPGLIDAHSHIAIAQGVNEGSDSVTAEVRVGDVLDATDINIYRQLAGGLTVANLLHGSANTIGGQSQVIKLRWGQTAPGLVFEGAAPSNKFALGENVKRSNWGGAGRYPATRMGVEQVLRDQFAAAHEYAAQWKAWRAKPDGRPAPRVDLRLQALAEILERKRLVHIHSYRADEILMFARMAKELGITVAAFQHVLEGYKVADAMASIGAGGSTFSDWWAYKMEVMDAVPENAVMMHRQGVLSSFNSDDADIARRMNVEAAKAVKYGGVSELEALNFVTLFPARQLRIDHRVGSLEVGKDADFVVWSGHPLSPASRAEQTWIEGRPYFSLESDAALQREARTERQRLLAKIRDSALATHETKPRSAGGDPSDDGEWARALQHLQQHQRHHRHSYSEAGSWHECTEDAR